MLIMELFNTRKVKFFSIFNFSVEETGIKDIYTLLSIRDFVFKFLSISWKSSIDFEMLTCLVDEDSWLILIPWFLEL